MSRPKQPKWLEIVENIKAQVRSGALGLDDQLPSDEALAAEYAVSKTTITRAMLELVNERIVERIQGVGTFVRKLPDTDDKWDTANSVMFDAVSNGWIIQAFRDPLSPDGTPGQYSYVIVGRRGHWTLHFDVAEGLVDAAVFSTKRASSVLRRKSAHATNALLRLTDSELDAVFTAETGEELK